MRYISLDSSWLMGCAEERRAEAEAEIGWPVEVVVAGVLFEGRASMTRGGNSGIGRLDILASSMAFSCSSMRW